MEQNSDAFQILSLDGGGIRGLFSAAILACLENDLEIRIADHFDLITGTSTGGIIALGLGAGLRPSQILEFYQQEGPGIFGYAQRSGLREILWKARQLVASKFDARPLETALKKVFGDKLLGDSQKRLVIPSYNLTDDCVYLFKTPHHERLRRDWRVPIWQAALATSAAPTFFPVSRHVDGNRLVDGGVWANNPSVVGIVEAVSILGIALERIKVFSLGTTNHLKGRPQGLNFGGLFQWRNDAVEVILRAQSCGANAQAIHLVGKDNVVRLDPTVPQGLFTLDHADLADLYAHASTQSRKFAPEFEQKLMQHVATPYTPFHSRQNLEATS